MADKEILINLNEQQRRDFYIKKNHNNLYLEILKFKTDKNLNLKFSELLYCYYNDTEPKLCKICNSSVKFLSFNKGYSKYCGIKCSALDSDLNEERYLKSKQAQLEKYGVDNPMKLQKFVDKVKATNLNKWGHNTYTKTDEYKKKMIEFNKKNYGVEWYQSSDEFKKKSKETSIKKYGIDHHTKTNEYKEKNKLKNIEKYGVEYYTQSIDYKQKIQNYLSSDKFKENTKLNKQRTLKKNIEYYKSYNLNYDFINFINIDEISLLCKKCDKEFIISKQLYYLRTKSNMKCCIYCNPKNGKNISKGEKELFEFIRKNYDGEIIENFTDKYEIDIYLPEMKIGFEFNGIWWHGELYKDKNYHLNKSLFFKNRNITIINIWEDDWEYKKEILESMIINKLGKIKNKIYARNCQIKEIDDNKIIRKFIDNNHRQGFINSKIKIGLYYKDELVSIMTFGNLRKPLGRKSNNNNWELLRYCNKLNTTIVGGASKLLNYFTKKYSFESIISYSDKSMSIGNLYNKIGFEKISESSPNYYWCKDSKRNYRYNFRKDILVKKGFDKSKSESEIMRSLNYYKLWDCGNDVFAYNK
jgi:hypothetical protein